VGAPPAGIFGSEVGDILISLGRTCGGNDLTGDRPFKLAAPIGGDAVTGISSLAPPLGCGLDAPESGWEALYQIATGVGWATFTDSNGTVYAPLVSPFVPTPAGPIGGAGFRKNALPIVMHVSDAPNHTPADYAPFFAGAASASTATAALTGIGARVITANSWSAGMGTDPQPELVALANATGASVPACAWSFNPDGTAATRPPGCGETQCCTGISGVGVPMTGGTCPLSLRLNDTGAGLSQGTVETLRRLVSFSALGVRVVAREDPARPGGLCLLRNVRPLSATTPVPGCTPSPTVFDPDPTLLGNEGFNDVTPGSALTFEVTGANDCIQEGAQERTFGVFIDLLGDRVALLGSHPITLIVPAN
jgi:hypothetical protein